MIRIKMLKPFNALKAGTILEQSDGVAEMWIHSGRAERMVPEPPALDVTINRPPKRSGYSRSRKRVTA